MDQFVVAIRPCPDYRPESVGQALSALLRDLGGITAFAASGQAVLLKPNLLAAEPPERAVTTHPEVVRAVAEAFRTAGATIVAGDSPGIGSCQGVAERTGVASAVRSTGGTVGRFDQVAYVGHGLSRRFPVATEVTEADLVVNLPKLKTHGMMVLSGAVKNLFGCVVGLRKPAYHFECQDTEAFAALLLELAEAVGPRLSIMDAVTAMEGPGPRNGHPRHVGLLAGARDPLALDFVLADLLGLPVRAVPHLRLAEERGLAQADAKARRVVGSDPDACRVAAFAPPPHVRSNGLRIPSHLHSFLRRSLGARPVVGRACADCGICCLVCPARAMTSDRGRARIDRRTCIRCYCCEEVCPHGAILLRQGMIGRLWPWG